MQADRGERPRRPARAAVDVVRGRRPAGPVPDQLPLLRPVRRARGVLEPIEQRVEDSIGVRARPTSIRRRSTRSAGTASSSACRRTSRASSSTTTATSSSSTACPEPPRRAGRWDEHGRCGCEADEEHRRQGPERAVRPRRRAVDHPAWRRSCGRTAASIVDDQDAPTRLDARHAGGARSDEQFMFDLRRHARCRFRRRQEVESEDDEARFLNGRLAMLLSPRAARRPASAPSTTSTGTWRRCRARPAGRDPPLRRVLPDEGLGARRTQRGSSSSSRSARRASGSPRRPGRTVPSLRSGRRVGCVPRPRCEAAATHGCSSTASRPSARCRRSRRGRRSRTRVEPELEQRPLPQGVAPKAVARAGRSRLSDAALRAARRR